MRQRRISVTHHIRGNVFGDGRSSAYKGVRADVHELVNAGLSAQDGKIFDVHVTGKAAVVG